MAYPKKSGKGFDLIQSREVDSCVEADEEDELDEEAGVDEHVGQARPEPGHRGRSTIIGKQLRYHCNSQV